MKDETSRLGNDAEGCLISGLVWLVITVIMAMSFIWLVDAIRNNDAKVKALEKQVEELKSKGND